MARNSGPPRRSWDSLRGADAPRLGGPAPSQARDRAMTIVLCGDNNKFFLLSPNAARFPRDYAFLEARPTQSEVLLKGARMDYFLQQLINGLSLGAIYGLIAIGYTMVY